MLAYQNPIFETEIDKPLEEIKKAINTVFIAKKTKYVEQKINTLLNTFSCDTMFILTLVRLHMQIQKVDNNKTKLKIEAQSPLGGGSKQTLQKVLDDFLELLTQSIEGKLIESDYRHTSGESLSKKSQLRILVVLAVVALAAAFIISKIIQ